MAAEQYEFRCAAWRNEDAADADATGTQATRRTGQPAAKKRPKKRVSRPAPAPTIPTYLVGDDHERLCVRLELAHEWVEPRNQIQVRLAPWVAVPQLHTT